jgi:hypothetical protein
MAAAILIFSGSTAAYAQEGYIYFAHGISGHDLDSTANPDLPIDIATDMGPTPSCLVKGAISSSFNGPYAVPAGTYNVAISQANTVAPCSNPAAITGTIKVTAGQSTLMIAAVKAGSPIGYVLPLDLSAVPAGQARVVFVNASSVPTLAFAFGTVATTAQVPGGYAVNLAPAGVVNSEVASGPTVLYGPGSLVLPSQSVLLSIATGSSTTGSFNLVGRYFLNLH